MIQFFTGNISYWPLAAFVILLFAGINVPVSEDAIIIISASIVYTDHSLALPTWIALYSGILISDIMCYFLGRLLSRGIRQVRFFRKKLTPHKVYLVSKTLDDYGFRTFIVTRFIPFGVRNTLFLGSGFVRLPFKKFVAYDSVAAFISCTTLYSLMLLIGHDADIWYKAGGVCLFVVLVIFAITMTVKVIKKESAAEKAEIETAANTNSLPEEEDK